MSGPGIKPYRRRVSPKKYEFARRMRERPTPYERILWNCLAERKLDGFKFRRQPVILGWIPDFYCAQAHLIVEVDGGYHTTPEQIEKDRRRDSVLIAHGFIVLRVINEEVFEDVKGTLRRIRAALPVNAIPSRRNAGEPGARGYRAGSREVKPAMSATKSRAL